MSVPILAARQLSKSFGSNDVLRGIEFEVHSGAAVALCGENGAGKSTLIKLMTGIYTPTKGHVELDGAKVGWSGPRDSMGAGVAVVHQEFSTLGALTVAENIFLEDEPRTRLGFVDRKQLVAQTRTLLDDLDIPLDPNAEVAGLSVAEIQMVEIAKALRADARVLILDEPTAVLSQHETEHLFRIIGNLRAKGLGLVYVSHRLDEIFEICTDITVIKDGVVTSSGPVSTYDHDKVVSAMVGREVGDMFPPKSTLDRIGKPLLEVKDFEAVSGAPKVDMVVRTGEIVGMAGLVGSGRTQLALSLFGVEQGSGEVVLDGQPLTNRSPAKCLEAGMVMLTESRKEDGLFPETSVALNFAASTLGKDANPYALGHGEEEGRSQAVVDLFNVVVDHVGMPISALSGGNQQKILIGRLLENTPKLLILDEPTRGVDVGAKAEIYQHLRKLADQGLAILMISSELIEVVGLSDRVYVMRDELIAAELTGDEITEDAIIAVAAADTPKHTHAGERAHA